MDATEVFLQDQHNALTILVTRCQPISLCGRHLIQDLLKQHLEVFLPMRQRLSGCCDVMIILPAEKFLQDRFEIFAGTESPDGWPHCGLATGPDF